MTTQRKFYVTTLTIKVLSEEPIPSYVELDGIVDEMDDGDYVGKVVETSEREVTGKEMADLLHDIGSEPQFFQIDDDGNDLED